MVFEKVREVFMDIMGFESDEIQLSSKIYDELDVDSLDISQIVLGIENEYKIDIDNDFIAEMETIEDFVKHIELLRVA